MMHQPHIDPPLDAMAEAARETEARWQGMRSFSADHAYWYRAALAPLVPALERQRRLRHLSPFTSHEAVLFSESTRYPFACNRCPIIVPQPMGTYRVLVWRKPTRIGFWLWPRKQPSYDVVGEGDAEYAAQLAESCLPADCGPAILGTEDDWKRLRREAGKTCG